MNPAAGPELRDIHLPPPPSWWPPAPGWWLLAALVIALLVFVSVYLYRKIRRRRLRRRLLAEFDSAVAAVHGDAPVLAAKLSSFLRRALLGKSRNMAALSGEAWLQHLDQQVASDEFSAGVGRALIEAPYRANADFDAAALIALVRRGLLATFDREAAHV